MGEAGVTGRATRQLEGVQRGEAWEGALGQREQRSRSSQGLEPGSAGLLPRGGTQDGAGEE